MANDYATRRLAEIEAMTGHPPSEAVRKLVESISDSYDLLPGARDDAKESIEESERNVARGLVLRIMAAIRTTEKAALDMAEREARALSAGHKAPDLGALRR